MPALTDDYIDAILEDIARFGDAEKKQCALILVDYLQRIPVKSRTELTDATAYLSNRMKDYADANETIVICGVQASRLVDTRADIVPQLSDGRHSASIEDAGDVHIGIARPVVYKSEGEPFEYAKKVYTVNDTLMVGRVNKDRDGKMVGNQFAFYFNPENGDLGDYQ